MSRILRGRRLRASNVACVMVLCAGVSTTWAQSCNPTEVAKLLAPEGGADDYFGYSVSVSGDAAVIGMYLDDDVALNAGAAYVYRRDANGQWNQEAKLHASDGAANDFFGYSVSISGDVILIGADDDGDLGLFSGSAYVFRRDANGQWNQEAKLHASDGTLTDQFGTSVAVSGDVAVIGAPNHDEGVSDSGAAYVFQWDGTQWNDEGKLLPPNGQHEGDYLGYSVAIADGVIVVGAPGVDGFGFDYGAAYVFRQGNPDWLYDGVLFAPDGGDGDQFGTSVSISGDAALVGALWNSHTAMNAGSAYVYRWNGSRWPLEAELLASDGAQDDRFGNAVAISGDVAVVGAYQADASALDSGAAYVFRFDGNGWGQDAKIVASDGADSDWFGWSVALDGDAAMIGAYQCSDLGQYSGATYAEDLNCTGGGLQLTVDGTCPGGGPIVISWSGATPGGQIVLVFARTTGNFHVPNGPCAGTVLGLGTNQIQIAYQGAAGNNGSRTLNAQAGNGACGGYFQLLDLGACSTSNVVQNQ